MPGCEQQKARPRETESHLGSCAARGSDVPVSHPLLARLPAAAQRSNRRPRGAPASPSHRAALRVSARGAPGAPPLSPRGRGCRQGWMPRAVGSEAVVRRAARDECYVSLIGARSVRAPTRPRRPGAAACPPSVGGAARARRLFKRA
eukprot:scaffold130430_cov30-Tisochrysis_lutea.AAC.1